MFERTNQRFRHALCFSPRFQIQPDLIIGPVSRDSAARIQRFTHVGRGLQVVWWPLSSFTRNSDCEIVFLELTYPYWNMTNGIHTWNHVGVSTD